MTGEPDTAIPMDAHPDPVLRYIVTDGEPRVVATNDAFDAAFGSGGGERPVSEVFGRFAVVDPTGDDDAVAHVARGDPVRIRLDEFGDGRTYVARVVGTGPDAGYLVFADVSGEVDGAAGVGDVASVLSHDLRNPLDVAEAHLRAARETGDDEHFDAVADAHDRMARIIRDVLTLARGDAVVDPADDVSIEDAVADAWCSVDTPAATLDVADPLPTTRADADRVRRLFENLFRNAVEHGSTANQTRPDDAEVTVTVGRLDGGFYVADDGPGIASEGDAVFDPGYTTSDGGAGLGLAIVDRIAAAHGWDLTLTEGADGGARFEVRV